MDILFIGKESDNNAKIASENLKRLFPNSIIVFGVRGEKFPTELNEWKGDYIFSYLSPWIIPEKILSNAQFRSINWHPGPPEYPGIGCTNFAIYNEEKVYGITCHDMLSKVDTGNIIEVLRFDIHENDSVYTMTQKCYDLILQSFNGIIDLISKHKSLPESGEHWQREPYTRKELDALSEIKIDMTLEEIEKRIKATTYDRPWAFIDVKGKKFFFR